MLRTCFTSYTRAAGILFVAVLIDFALSSVTRADDFAEHFRAPPAEAGMTVHWVWPGPAITREGIDRDLLSMRRAHISGATVLPVYPLAADDEKKGIVNLNYLSPEFLEMLAYAARRAREMGMMLDVSLGTGWPFGGPWIDAATGARMLRMRAGGDPVKPGEQFFARLGDQVFVSSPTRQTVKRAALGDEGLVVDHLSSAALKRHLDSCGEKLSGALRDTPIRAFWCDSLEAYGSGWTADFPAQFRRRRGYELTPHLPLLFGPITAEARQVRRDFWLTNSELVADEFFKPLQQWCHDKGTRLRAEQYGQPPVSLGAFQYVDLPTGEHYEWRMLNATRWASSGGHLYSKNLIDAEAWTWTGIPNRFADSLEQLKLASDMHFVSGANTLMGVSYVHTPPQSDKEYWLAYWGPFLSERQTWWPYFPLLSRYIQRVSWILQQGQPVANVALYLPIDDCFAEAPADNGLNLYFDVRERLHGGPIPEFSLKSAITGNTPVISTLINNGYNFDSIDSTTLPHAQIDGKRLKMGLCDFGLVVLPNLAGIPLADLQKLADFVRAGGTLIATRRLPDIAYGLSNHQADTARVRELVREMFSHPTYGAGRAILAKDDAAYLAALKSSLSPDLQLQQTEKDVAFVHRRLRDRDFYFIANLGQREKILAAKFAVAGSSIRVFDPMTGLEVSHSDDNFHLDPAGSVMVEISNAAAPARSPKHDELRPAPIAGPWTLGIPGQRELRLDQPRLWTDDAENLHFSGTASYATTFEFDRPAGTARVALDLGDVREIAEVWLNEKPAGVVWKHPYQIDVTNQLQPGANTLEVRVTNLLINEVLGKPQPDYSAIHKRFGQRFSDPDEWKLAKPLPSGLIGPVKLHIFMEHAAPR